MRKPWYCNSILYLQCIYMYIHIPGVSGGPPYLSMYNVHIAPTKHVHTTNCVPSFRVPQYNDTYIQI